MSPPLALLVVGGPRVHALKRGLTESHWRVEAAATVFDAIKQLPLKPSAIVCDASVGDLKLRKLLSDPGCGGVAIYALDSEPQGATSLKGLDDQSVITRLVAKHGGRVVAPRHTAKGDRFEPLDTWWEANELHVEVEGEQASDFLALARESAALTHPAVPRSLAITRGDRAHATWELPRGASLASISRLLHHENTLLSLEAVCTLGHATAETLSAIHAGAQFHGMVRPWSLWVTDRGELWVRFARVGRLAEADRTVQRKSTFGLAGRLDDLAPEQLSGAAVGPKTDLYQLGHLLFEALTGRSPFGGGNPRLVLEGERPALDADDLPASISELPPRLLAIDPARRPGATDVLAALAPYRGDAGAVRNELAQWVKRFHEELE